MRFNRFSQIIPIIIVLLCTGFAFSHGQGVTTTAGDGIRVGVYDSRSVAIAYARSSMFSASMLELKAEYTAAEKDGKQDRMDEIGEEMHAQQDLFHKQAFSIWTVRDILERIQDELPGIAEEAGVDILVSKWDIAYKGEDLSFVDVTAMIVRPFNPDEETMKILSQVKDKDPVPLEELSHEH